MVAIHSAPETGASRIEVVRRLRSLERIPLPPQEQQRLLNALAEHGVELEDLADLIDQSPPVAARVMGVARSAFFASGAPARSVRDAVVRVLGLRLVSDLVHCAVLSSPLEVGRCHAFEPGRYWSSAIVTATLARSLASDATRIDPQVRCGAYLAGLLHNLGLLILVHLDPEAMSEVFAEVDRGDSASLTVLERERLGITHAEAGERLAATWRLSPEIGAVMRRCGERRYRGDHWMLALLVGSAAGLAKVLLGAGDESRHHVADLELLGICPLRLERRLDELSGSLEALGELAAQFT